MSSSPDYYESTGTIRLKIGCEEENIFFVPDTDHRVKHQGKEYAVFLPEGSCKDAPEGSCKDAPEGSCKDAKVTRLNNSVELTLSICNCKMNTVFTALLDAAMNQKTVDVKVKLDDKKLIGITVPALSVK